MDLHRTTITDPTLDPERTDQLRTFLTVEAAADAAATASRSRHRAARLVAGVAAAVVLGAGLVAVTSVAGVPGSGPASVQTAHAVTIEPAAPGWTKVTIRDIDADPDAVVAELRAAGIDARREVLPVQRDGEGRLTLGSFDESTPTNGGFTIVGAGATGDEGLAGLSVSAPGAAPSALDGLEGASSEEIETELQTYLHGVGAKMGFDGSIEIRNDADLTILVLTEA